MPAAGLGRQAGARISTILSGGALRWDCLQEGQRGDVIILPEMADFSIVGSKADVRPGRSAAVLRGRQLRVAESASWTLQPGTRAALLRLDCPSCAGLLLLYALPPDTRQQVADRFRASRSDDRRGKSPRDRAGL